MLVPSCNAFRLSAKAAKKTWKCSFVALPFEQAALEYGFVFRYYYYNYTSATSLVCFIFVIMRQYRERCVVTVGDVYFLFCILFLHLNNVYTIRNVSICSNSNCGFINQEFSLLFSNAIFNNLRAFQFQSFSFIVYFV